VQKALADIEKKKLPKEEEDSLVLELKTKYDLQRQKVLASVSSRAGGLTLPEFMRIMHSYKIAAEKKMGGAPGYLSFLGAKYKALEKAMGEGVCTPNKYLRF
ncbi:MAG TPA: hypothetical protein VN132_02395, partial [Bdellovibrio sp.]|nr:hypothetical protein [Bdellovibrio sp.]